MNVIHPVLIAVVAFAIPATVVAQTTRVLPAEYERAWGRGSSAGLGSNSSRTQHIFNQPFPTGTPVFGVGFRPTGGVVDRAAFTADVEIQMSSTASTPGALSSTFASNIGSDMVVALPRQMVNIPAMPANRPTSQFARFMFPAPFPFGLNTQPNINVDLFVFSRTTGASWSTDRGFAAVNGRAANAGIGCGSGTVTSSSVAPAYLAGSSMTVSLANAPAMAPAVLLPSVDMSEFAPGIPLPIALSTIGAGVGCDLLVRPHLGSFPMLANATGAASVTFTIPGGVAQIGTGWQWGYFVPPSSTNPFGLEVTNNRAVWIGPEVITPRAQYVWDLSNVNSATGNETTNSVPVVLFLLP